MTSAAAAMEQQIKQTVETFMTNVRRDLDAHLGQLTANLLRIAQETRDASDANLERAVNDARAEAERSFGSKLEALAQETQTASDA
jgi:hypothetical protein